VTTTVEDFMDRRDVRTSSHWLSDVVTEQHGGSFGYLLTRPLNGLMVIPPVHDILQIRSDTGFYPIEKDSLDHRFDRMV
jgi:hypothetical protein